MKASGLTLILLFVFLRKATSTDRPQSAEVVLERKPGSVQTQYCNPNYTENGEIKLYTIGQILRSGNILDCPDAISSDLVAMFSNDGGGLLRRMDTKDSVINLCPAFVNLTSTVILSGYGDRPGPNLREVVCLEKKLTKEDVEDKDFCRILLSEHELNVGILEALGDRYSTVAKKFQELVSMNERECKDKCGSGSKRVLCNSFYSLSSILGLSSTGNTGPGNTGAENTGEGNTGAGNAGVVKPKSQMNNDSVITSVTGKSGLKNESRKAPEVKNPTSNEKIVSPSSSLSHDEGN